MCTVLLPPGVNRIAINKSLYHLSIYLSIHLSIHPSIHPSIHLSIYLSIYLSTYLPTYLPIYLSVHPSIHPSIWDLKNEVKKIRCLRRQKKSYFMIRSVSRLTCSCICMYVDVVTRSVTLQYVMVTLDHHHKHQGLDPLIRSVSTVTAARANASSVCQLFSFLVVCGGMISKGFGFVAFFASVKASSVCIHLSCPVCL